MKSEKLRFLQFYEFWDLMARNLQKSMIFFIFLHHDMTNNKFLKFLNVQILRFEDFGVIFIQTAR